jgi:hypothetical protein
MSNSMGLAEKIQKDILELPQESLPELENYIEFLRFKVRSSAKSHGRSRSGRQATMHPDRAVSADTFGSMEANVTEADVALLHAQLIGPHKSSAVRELAQAYRLAEQEAALSEEEQARRFRENVEAIRAEAVAAGTTIEEPADLLADD